MTEQGVATRPSTPRWRSAPSPARGAEKARRALTPRAYAGRSPSAGGRPVDVRSAAGTLQQALDVLRLAERAAHVVVDDADQPHAEGDRRVPPRRPRPGRGRRGARPRRRRRCRRAATARVVAGQQVRAARRTRGDVCSRAVPVRRVVRRPSGSPNRSTHPSAVQTSARGATLGDVVVLHPGQVPDQPGDRVGLGRRRGQVSSSSRVTSASRDPATSSRMRPKASRSRSVDFMASYRSVGAVWSFPPRSRGGDTRGTLRLRPGNGLPQPTGRAPGSAGARCLGDAEVGETGRPHQRADREEPAPWLTSSARSTRARPARRFMIFDHAGNEVGRHQLEHEQILPQRRLGRARPDRDLAAHQRRSSQTRAATSRPDAPRDLAALGITNQRETTVVWDRSTGRPVLQRHRLAGHPHRPHRHALERDGRGDIIRRRPACRRPPTSPAGKIHWILDNVDGRPRRPPSAATRSSAPPTPGCSGTSPAAPTAARTSPTSPTPAAPC